MIYAADEYAPEITEAELIAQDAEREGRAGDAAKIREVVLAHVAECARDQGAEDASFYGNEGGFGDLSQADEWLINGVGITYCVEMICGLASDELDVDMAWSAIGDTFMATYLKAVREATEAGIDA